MGFEDDIRSLAVLAASLKDITTRQKMQIKQQMLAKLSRIKEEIEKV